MKRAEHDQQAQHRHCRPQRALSLPGFAGILLIAACTEVPPLPEGIAPITLEEAEAMQAIAATRETLEAFYTDTTTRSFTPWHGNQIEYLSPDGKAFLWYPGNVELVIGDWRTEQLPDERRARMCYRYGPDTYNPVTEEAGGQWSCRFAAESLYISDEIVDGDPVGLSGGALPFVMPEATEITLAEAVARLGRDPITAANKVAWSWRAEVPQ
ncbi:MAG: hypothetical protein AAFR40_09600 [Pseudomonadota bacterium]